MKLNACHTMHNWNNKISTTDLHEVNKFIEACNAGVSLPYALLISGAPGSGKTTLLADIVGHINGQCNPIAGPITSPANARVSATMVYGEDDAGLTVHDATNIIGRPLLHIRSLYLPREQVRPTCNVAMTVTKADANLDTHRVVTVI